MRAAASGIHGGRTKQPGNGYETESLMANVDARDASVAELAHRLSDQTTTLVRQELRLIQAEMEEKAKEAGKGAGILTGAGVMALGGFGPVIAGLILAIGEGLAMWLSAFIVAAGLFLIAGITALMGKQRVTAAVPPKPEETMRNTERLDEFLAEANRLAGDLRWAVELRDPSWLHGDTRSSATTVPLCACTTCFSAIPSN